MAWSCRARGAVDAAMDMGPDVSGAARQWNFERRGDAHPVDAVDDPALAKAALATVVVELGGPPSAADQRALLLALRSRLEVSLPEAEELITLGRWLGRQSGGPAAAVSGLLRRLARIGEPGVTDDLADLVAMAVRSEPNDAQAGALNEIALRLGR